MRTALAGVEFWKVVGELDRCWKERREFDKEVVGFEYWRRARGTETENRPWGAGLATRRFGDATLARGW